jgi:hypothetical protein
LILEKECAPDKRGDEQSECESKTAQREPQRWMGQQISICKSLAIPNRTSWADESGELVHRGSLGLAI